MLFRKCVFQKNGMAFNLKNPYFKMLITKCSFEENQCCVYASILDSIEKDTKNFIDINDSFFTQNASVLKLKNIPFTVKFHQNLVSRGKSTLMIFKKCLNVCLMQNFFEKNFAEDLDTVSETVFNQFCEKSIKQLSHSKLRQFQKKINDPSKSIIMNISSTLLIKDNKFTSNNGSLICIKQIHPSVVNTYYKVPWNLSFNDPKVQFRNRLGLPSDTFLPKNDESFPCDHPVRGYSLNTYRKKSLLKEKSQIKQVPKKTINPQILTQREKASRETSSKSNRDSSSYLSILNRQKVLNKSINW